MEMVKKDLVSAAIQYAVLNLPTIYVAHMRNRNCKIMY